MDSIEQLREIVIELDVLKGITVRSGSTLDIFEIIKIILEDLSDTNMEKNIHPMLRFINVIGSDPTLFAPPAPVVNPVVTKEKETKDKESEDKGYGKLSFFLLGLFIGSILEPFTIVVMLLIGVLVNNQPFPESLGSVTPQELLVTIIKNFIRSVVSLMTKDQNKPKS